MANFNKYWEDHLDKKLKNLVDFNKKKRVTSVLKGEFILGLIKESTYNRTEPTLEIVNCLIDGMEIKQALLNSFLREFKSFPSHCLLTIKTLGV